MFDTRIRPMLWNLWLASITVDSYAVEPLRHSWGLVVVASGSSSVLQGWVEHNGEWEWDEEDPNYVIPSAVPITAIDDDLLSQGDHLSNATPKLPSGVYKPKQSLGQNYLKDPNTVAKILRSFDSDAVQESVIGQKQQKQLQRIIELGPGAGALTDPLILKYGVHRLHCIEIDERSVTLLREKHPDLLVQHADVLQVDYPSLAALYNHEPLTVIGNLPYYITSQILFALADAAHQGAVRSATVTMQWEVGQRLVAKTSTKDYGILSVVFQLYCSSVKCHFKIPPTVFYPQPKVDSALLGLHFLTPHQLRQRLAGVSPSDLRRVVTATFQQRRKTVRNSLKQLLQEQQQLDPPQIKIILDASPVPLPKTIQQAADQGDTFAQQQNLPEDWATKRPEELSPGQFVELTRLLFGKHHSHSNTEMDMTSSKHNNNVLDDVDLGYKVWRKLKHGTN